MYDLKESLTRQSDLIPLKVLGTPIEIIGAGAVGSWASLALAKMGYINQTVWDYDTVDTVNMSCQFFPHTAIGEPKVEALHKLVRDFTGFDIAIAKMKWEGTSLHKDITLSCADSMEVRKAVFNSCVGRWIIDSRMASEYLTVYVVDMHNPKQKASYAKTLHSDKDAVQEPCTGKSTIYCANIIGGMVAKSVKNITCEGNKIAFQTTLDLTENAYLSYEAKD